MRFQILEFRFRIGSAAVAIASLALVKVLAQAPLPGSGSVRLQPDWSALEPEIMQQFQAVLRFDTRNPPGNEHIVAEYLKGVFDKAGIPAQVFALDANRSNVVARLKGNGKKKPLLIMGHSDVVTVDEAKWKFPPFSATRDGGWVYARGTVDDKDNLTGGLMTMLLLKRFNVPLDRDVIFLSEAGEEGSSNFGMQFMVNQHYPEIESEYCLAEGGGAIRIGGVAKYTTVETLEKIPRGIELVAHGISGHGSIPLKSNAIVHLAGAVAKVGQWRPEIRFNETTGTYFRGLASIAAPENAKYYRDVLSTDPKLRAAADEWLFENEPLHSSMLRTSVSPNIFAGGYRSNVIPSEAKATLDVRALPDEDPAAFLEQVKKIVDDPAVDVHFHGAERAAGFQVRRSPRLGAVQGARGGGHTRLRHGHPADDEHGRDRHGAAARPRRAVLRHRRRDRHGRRPQRLRHAQRSGTAARDGALQVRPLQLRGRGGTRQGEMRFQILEFRFQIGGAAVAFQIGGAVVALASLALVTVLAQAPPPDWTVLEPEIMRHYQAVLRLDTTNPPGNEHLAVDYLKQLFDAEGIPLADLRPRSQPFEHRRAPDRERKEAAATDHGPHRRRHGRRLEVEVSAVQRDPRRRLRLRSRHHRRQGQTSPPG